MELRKNIKQIPIGCVIFFFQTCELNNRELLTDDVHILFTHIITLKILIL